VESVFGFFLFGISLIWLYRRVVFGVITEAMVRGLKDFTTREKALSVFFICILFLMGIVPKFPLDFAKVFSAHLYHSMKEEPLPKEEKQNV
jgi:NADH:ubiquinone oxidoreductase subunit 4 (subunit M)